MSPVKSETSTKIKEAKGAVFDQPKPVIDIKAAEDLKESDKKPKTTKISESEFVSDEFQTSNETDLAEIKDGMRKLGIDSMTQQALASNDGKRF